jgi:RHS repeat-associated protein
VYRTETYAVDEDGAAGSKLVSDSYYDRNGRLVASSSPGAGATEYAFDGAGRQTETRLVTELEADRYDANGAFAYRDPQPGATTGGDDKVLQMTRTVYDPAGYVISEITMEASHDDTDGLDLSNHDDYVQMVVHTWHSTWGWDIDRSRRSAWSYNYGTCGDDWTYNALTERASELPDPGPAIYSGYDANDYSNAYVNGGNVYYTYPDGALEGTYNYLDNLGRVIRVREPVGESQYRVTLLEYDGLGNVTRRIADMDGDDATFDGGEWTTDADDEITTYLFEDDYSASLVTNVIYPDSTDTDSTGNDQVKLDYYLDGLVKTRTAQKASGDTANVLTFTYDDVRRLSLQAVTTPGTGVATDVQAIGYSYDAMGRREKVTSYSDAEATTAVNEVAYEYNDLGAMAEEYQEHEGVKDANSLYVQYGYDLTASSGIYTAASRLQSMQYPNGRDVYQLYADSGDTSGIADKISRVTAIASASTRGQSDANVLAAYSHNGAGRMVIEDFVQPDVRLDYWGQTADTYAGFDRFGRVVDQLWYDYGASEDRDEFTYGYDIRHNRLYRENTLHAGLDELYAYDYSNRLTGFQRGDLNEDRDEIPTNDRNRGQAWGLDSVGNWSDFQTDADGDGDYTDAADLDQGRTHNLANEIYNATAGAAITEQADPAQAVWPDPIHDARGNMTTIPQPGDLTATYTCTYDVWNRLVEVRLGGSGNVVMKNEYDGLNRRVKQHVNTTPAEDNACDQFRHFFYNAGWQVLETRVTTSENTQPEDGAVKPEQQFVWSQRYIDAPILRDRDADADPQTGNLGASGSGLDERLYYLTDANMNVTALVDTGGAAVERYVYDPYGAATIYDGSWTDTRSASTYSNTVLFAGYWRDAETGLYHVRNRTYHAQLGRWIQRDTAYSDGMALYVYVMDNPMYYVDFWGLQAAGTDDWEDQLLRECRITSGIVGGRGTQKNLIGIQQNVHRAAGYGAQAFLDATGGPCHTFADW